jgi:ParB family chromosome partitioning protein
MTALPAFSSVEKAAPAPKELSDRERARAEGRRRKKEQEEQALKEAAAKVDAGGVEAQPLVPLGPVRKGRERDLLDGKAEYKLVPINDLHPDPDQPRKTFRDIHLLAANLKEMGMLQPIVARIGPDNKLIIFMGERRWKAAQVAGWTHVPVIIRYGVQDTGILARQLMENAHRDDMDPIDEARAIRRIMRDEKIATHDQAAKRLGHSQPWVSTRLALLNLDEDTQAEVSSGALGVTAAAARGRAAAGVTRSSSRSSTSAYGSSTWSPSRTPSYTPASRTLPHFSEDHFLAGRARSRCVAQSRANDDHTGLKIGGIACGSCWEVVIRQDARRNPDLLTGDK